MGVDDKIRNAQDVVGMKHSRRGSSATSGGVAGLLACTPKWSRYIVAAKVRGDAICGFNVEFHVLMYLGMQQ